MKEVSGTHRSGSTNRLSTVRALAAMLLAPVIPSAIFATWAANNENWGGIFMLTLFVALLLTVLLGFPTFLLLQGRITPRAIYAMAVGGLIPTMPLLLLNALIAGQFHWSMDQAVGYIMYFGLGAMGGFLFWAQVIGSLRDSPCSKTNR